jgi:NAD-dependent deacetylase
MTIFIDDCSGVDVLRGPAELVSSSRKTIAITGAGISVESGIPDFRSPGGLWERFSPEEYAYLGTFLENPEKSWKLFREMGRTLQGKEPNPAHRALAGLEERDLLHAVITQNIDGLHQQAGSRRVIEVHGDHRHLECMQCGLLSVVRDEHMEGADVPRCSTCGFPLKPAVVLFGEPIRAAVEIEEALDGCDILLVVGTSAQVQPVASLPWTVKAGGGTVIEFNLQATPLTDRCTDYFIRGSASTSLAALVERIDRMRAR